MATQPLSNVIDPPPRLTGDAGQDTVAVIQWLSAFYVKGILSGGLLQPQNMDQSLISLGALAGEADMLAYYTAEDVFDLTGFTAFARTLLDDADADAARATLGAGDVVGPGSSTNNHVAVFDGATGKLLKDGGAPAGDVVGPAGATSGNVVLFDTATGKLIKDGGTLGSAAFTASGAYDVAGAAAAAQAASQPADADLTTWAGITPGTGVATALAINVDTAGAVVVNGGALGTPSSGTLTNCSGLPAAGVVGTALVAAAIGVTVQAYDADLVTWAGITPGANVATFLATPSSANLAAALTDETGSGKVVFNNKPDLIGTVTNDNAAAGSYGEYVEGALAYASATSLTNNTYANLTSISLTAGDWDVSGLTLFTPSGTTVVNQITSCISTTSAADGGEYNGIEVVYPVGTVPSNNVIRMVTPMVRLSLNATTTVYLVVVSNFTTSTLTASGKIRARRIR